MPTTQSVIAALAPLADPTRAPPMRAYMRDQFEFLGIPTPARRAAIKPIARELSKADPAELIGLAQQLWGLPEREYHYAALDILAANWRLLAASELPELIVLAQQKSWWDSVDGLAAIIGDILRGRHDGMDEALAHGNFWVRRIALLHQLGWRERTDQERLFRYALACAHEHEFFIQKAIGWALRDYARHAPESVRAFLAGQGTGLAALSRREAAKHL
ncbi:DNA alkylation repair protein [Massilia sp. SR12]